MNYAKDFPVDKKGNALPVSLPPYISTQSQAGVPTASSVITLNDKTTVLDVSAIGGAAANGAIIGKWGSASVTATNFDFFVQSGTTRTLVVPVSVQGTSSVAGANVSNGLYNSVAVKTATAQSTSIFTAEY